MGEEQKSNQAQVVNQDAVTKYLSMIDLSRMVKDPGMTTTIKPGGEVVQVYKPMIDNLRAQTQATEQVGLPSYGGIDAKDVMELMRQRTIQDQQMRQQPLDMNTLLSGLAQRQYQGQMGQAAMDAPGHQMDRLQVAEQGMNDRQSARDMMTTGREYIRQDAMNSRDRKNRASREKIAKIVAQSRATGREPSLLELNDAFSVATTNKNGESIQPSSGEMDVLDGLFREQGYKIQQLPIKAWDPWGFQNHPAQSMYILTPNGQKPSLRNVRDQLLKMGYKNISDAEIKELTGVE